MKAARTRSARNARAQPPSALVAKIRRLRRSRLEAEASALSESFRQLLRRYASLVATGGTPSSRWRALIGDALRFLGGQADRSRVSLRDYDSLQYGPFLGVSDEGSSAPAVRRAALDSAKSRALGRRHTPLNLGVAVDAERLGAVGEVPVGPDEFAQIWRECVGRMLMTTNVGSRANVRFYRDAPVVTIVNGADQLDIARSALAAAFKPFLEAPGGARPLIVFVQFSSDSRLTQAARRKLLRELQAHVRNGGVADPKVHALGLGVLIGSGQRGARTAKQAIDLAQSVGLTQVAIDGVVRNVAERAVSLPGLLNYLPEALVQEVLLHAKSAGVYARPFDEVDPDTVARDIWSSVNSARSYGLHLGKYGLVPLTLEESDAVVGKVQQWFADWSAAPVFYIDQGLLTRHQVFSGARTSKGIDAWLRMVAKHKVPIVLIDTVDKSKGWKILRSDGDPKGLLEARDIARLTEVGSKLGIRVLWAGGITAPQAYELGRLGVFGIYVTTAAAEAIPVGHTYRADPALAAEKEPTYEGVLGVKTLLEAGFLIGRFQAAAPRVRKQVQLHLQRLEKAQQDVQALRRILPTAWRAWWRVARA